MPSPGSELSLEQITGWIRQAAETSATAIEGLDRSTSGGPAERSHPGFDFKRARQALDRARTKNDSKAPQPFRRLRRNQEAVNQGLIDTCRVLISVNKQMAAEISALTTDVANLRRHLARREAAEERLAKTIARGDATTR